MSRFQCGGCARREAITCLFCGVADACAICYRCSDAECRNKATPNSLYQNLLVSPIDCWEYVMERNARQEAQRASAITR